METNLILENSQAKKKAIGLIHRTYLCQLKNSRKYLAYTKTKSEVRGGGKKPWRQKGTGRARAGSIRSPLWVGGGVIFGPKPRVVIKKVNQKEKRLATFFTFLLKQKNLVFLQETDFQFEKIETKKVANLLKQLKLNLSKKILIILNQKNHNFWLSSRNLRKIDVTTVSCLNLKQLLNAEHILLSQECFKTIQNKYGKE